MTEIWEQDEPDIVTGAMLVELNLKNLGLTRKLGIASIAVADTYGNKEMFTGGHSPTTRTNKWIIPKQLYDPIASFQRETRKIHNEYTCSMRWTTNQDIMSTTMYSGGGYNMPPYAEFVEDRKMELEALAHSFAYTIYPQAIITAKNDLGSLYDEYDYMDQDDAYKSICMDVRISPIAKGSDFRCSLDPSVQKERAKEHEQRLREVQKESVMKLIAGLSEKVQHVHDSIDNDKILHDKTLEDLYKHAVNLPAIDFTSDSTLSDIAGQVAMGLMNMGTLNKDSLKDESVRGRTKTQANDLARKLDAYADTKKQEK
jgi:hypothetical protein